MTILLQTSRGLVAMSLLLLHLFLTSTTTHAFQALSSRTRASWHSLPPVSPRSKDSLALSVHVDREADMVELLVGGERYSMVPLPDSMVSTTLFVGNLCEFVHDEDLSQLFQTVSVLQSVPACVARKPNMASLCYGFVTFPSVEEKEKAIIRFHGTEWRGREIKVEPIRDHPSQGRVRVPERIVDYVSGRIKRTRRTKGKNKNGPVLNELRRISRMETTKKPLKKAAAAKRKNHKTSSASRRTVSYKLNDGEHAELERAERKGFLTVSGGQGSHRSRGRGGHFSSALTKAHRQKCAAKSKPQITLFKAVGTRGRTVVDQVLVDLSPLRLHGQSDDAREVEESLLQWKRQILTAAGNAGMRFRDQEDEDVDDDSMEQGRDDDESDMDPTLVEDQVTFAVPKTGVFEGERKNAKAMAKELAKVWEIPEEPPAATFSGTSAGGKTPSRRKGSTRYRDAGLSAHRRRGGGHRQAWF